MRPDRANIVTNRSDVAALVGGEVVKVAITVGENAVASRPSSRRTSPTNSGVHDRSLGERREILSRSERGEVIEQPLDLVRLGGDVAGVTGL